MHAAVGVVLHTPGGNERPHPQELLEPVVVLVTDDVVVALQPTESVHGRLVAQLQRKAECKRAGAQRLSAEPDASATKLPGAIDQLWGGTSCTTDVALRR